MFEVSNIKQGGSSGSGQFRAALEGYPQAIFRIERREQHTHADDIAAALDVAKSAVTTALPSLSEKGFVNYERYEPVASSNRGGKPDESFCGTGLSGISW